MEFKPHAYQAYCEQRIIKQPKLALFLDMGLGKTVITLSAIKELKYYRWCVSKVLIIAPKKVAEATWRIEAAKWESLSLLRVSTVLGTDAQRRAALAEDADIYVINRDNVQWLVNYYTDARCKARVWPFDMVVLDESSSFKNHQAKRFKALKAMLPRINRLLLLTGTPAPHGLEDLWAQIYLLDGGQRLGRTISVYRDMYFMPDKRNATTIFSYKPKDGAAEVIYNSISDICVSMKAADYLDLPDCVMDTVPVVLDKKAAEAYKRLERETLLQLPDDTIITAGTAGVLTGKLLQLCNGAVYGEDGKVNLVHDCKIEAFKELIEQLNGQHVLVFYSYQHDKARLLEALAGTKLHTRVYTGEQDEADWNAGKIDVLLAHPASCAYGLNLQRGGHHAVWFGLTWSLEQYQQANKRLHRQGQTCPVIIHHLVVQDSVDEDVMRALDSKEGAQECLLAALKARLQTARGEGFTKTP